MRRRNFRLRVSSAGQTNDGVLYPLLTKFESGGIIHGREEVGAGKRKRTIFSVPAKGETAFLAWLESDADEIHARMGR
jgi:DNA-binding PadR family transcriptional regulator